MTEAESIQKLETLRKASKRREHTIVGLFVGGFVLDLALIVIFSDFAGFILLVGFLFLFVLVFVTSFQTDRKRAEFRRLYKETFVVPVLNEYIESGNYMYDKGFDKSIVSSFQLVELSNGFGSSEYLTGICKGVSFTHSEVLVNHVIYARRNRRRVKVKTIPYFHGRMFIFDLFKKYVPRVRIYSKNFEHADRSQEGTLMVMVSSDYPTLEGIVDIMAVAGQDISSIMTRRMEDLIIHLHNTYGNLGMNIKDGKLYLCFEYPGDVFDADKDKPLDYQEERNRILKEIQPILDVVEVLKEE